MKMDKERSTFYHNKLVSQIPKLYTSLKMQKNVHKPFIYFLQDSEIYIIHLIYTIQVYLKSHSKVCSTYLQNRTLL